MRWIDIFLPEPETDQEFDALMAQAIGKVDEILELQEKEGLDSSAVTEQMADVGRILFKALSEHDPQAFSPDRDPIQVVKTPEIGVQEHDDLTGYQIITAGPGSNVPWTWLHNGLGFIFQKHPICVADHGAALPDPRAQRPWMSRCRRASFLVGEEGECDLYHTIDQLRLKNDAQPEILFVAGHTEPQIRRLMRREAEAIEGALASERLGCYLAGLTIPTESLTPSQLQAQGMNYQAIHFAGPTSMPAEVEDTQGEYWMNNLIEEINTPQDQELEEAIGVEGEVVGVDPITALLDSVGDRYDREGLSTTREPGGGGIPPLRGLSGPRNSWLLDDGPVAPESMSHAGGLPPLVFSNSHRSLPELGERFTAAGASTFMGPMVPIFSRPARIFASYAYRSMADGWSSGAAIWHAAKQIRQELGADHPAWLSYGVRGYGSLSMQYL